MIHEHYIVLHYTCTWFSIFFKSYQYLTSLFTDGTFYLNLINFHEYFMQHSLKSGGTKDHFRRVKMPGTIPYWKACSLDLYPARAHIGGWFGRRNRLVKVDFVFSYFLHLSFMKMLISCTCLLKSIVSVIKYFESDFLGK